MKDEKKPTDKKNEEGLTETNEIGSSVELEESDLERVSGGEGGGGRGGNR